MASSTRALNWPEYFMEAAGLGLFMLSACLFGTLLGHPDSPVVSGIPSEGGRRVLMGLAMGVTSIALVYSPWGLRSGGHFNPAFTLTFLRLGKVRPRDAAGYIAAQFIGAVAGVMLGATLVGSRLADEPVRWVVTVPGPLGVTAAFAGEVGISGMLIMAVLVFSNAPQVARYTGIVAGALVALYIAVESPISGMSMNPARTFGSAWWGDIWTAFWIYLAAPLLGMLLGAELYLRRGRAVFCAKLVHRDDRPCIFCRSQTGR